MLQDRSANYHKTVTHTSNLFLFVANHWHSFCRGALLLSRGTIICKSLKYKQKRMVSVEHSRQYLYMA